MKLSEAIHLGSMLKPQGFGFTAIRSAANSCALGAALDACGVPMAEREGQGAYDRIQQLWPWAASGVMDTIWSRNDIQEWSRERIADWVATIEPQSPAAGEAPTVVSVSPVSDAEHQKAI